MTDLKEGFPIQTFYKMCVVFLFISSILHHDIKNQHGGILPPGFLSQEIVKIGTDGD